MNWGYLLKFWYDYGLKTPLKCGVSSHPHALITGASGSGKSKALLFLTGQLLKCCPEITLYLCDFKNSDDFAFLKGYPHYYAGNACYDGIMDYYARFTEAREDGSNAGRYILICDEYPAFLNYLQMKDKANKTKLANNILGAVAEVLMLGRGIGFGIWLVTQRADSTLFANGARDNFMVIVGLGRLSKEQKGMVFPGQEIPDTVFLPGEGMLLADGREIVAVKYPKLTNEAGWKAHILAILKGKSCG